MRPADDEAAPHSLDKGSDFVSRRGAEAQAYRVYVKPTQRSIGAKGALLPGAHTFQELYISLKIRAGGAGEIVGHAAALVGTEGQDDRFAETAEGEVAGVEGTEFRFKGQKNVAGVLKCRLDKLSEKLYWLFSVL